MNQNNLRIILKVGLIFIFGMLLVIFIFGNSNSKQEITYDQVVTYIETNEITKIESQQESLKITLTLKDGTVKNSIVPNMEEFSNFILEEIKTGNEIEFKVKKASMFSNPFFSVLTTIIAYVLIFSLIPKMMSGMTGGKYDVKPVTSNKKFVDVAGIEEEKEQLVEVVQFLKQPDKYYQKGAKIPKGILLVGKPGTGKTLLAKAIAGEARVPFFQVTGSSFEEKFVGVGASRVRELFAEAKKCAPSIIFIDEIDSVAQTRYSGKSYSEQTLNQLLAEMDGFDERCNVIVIAATNYVEVLDPALLRPGRFDRHVYVPMPDVVAREKILKVHARNKIFAEDILLSDIAKKTVGFSGADLENVLNEAVIHSINKGVGVICKDDIEESIARVLVGLAKKNSAITKEDMHLTAVHEAGHAIVSAVVRPEVENFCISIIPRGNAGGYNFFDDADKKYLRKSELIKQMQVLYGGRAAEEIILNDISSGANNDFEKASEIGHKMLTRFGMNGSFVTKIPSEPNFNKNLDSLKMEELENFCKEVYDEAISVIRRYKAEVLELAELLEKKEYLSSEEIESFINEKI